MVAPRQDEFHVRALTQCRLPGLDGPARDCSGGDRADRKPCAADRLSLVAVPDHASLLPAAEPDGGDYVLTGPESLRQAEQVRLIGDVLGRRVTFEELSPDEFRSDTQGSWPRPVVDMLLAAWEATMGRPAFVTSTVSDILGSPPRTFRQWVADHVPAFMRLP
jgi:hypothetical protein